MIFMKPVQNTALLAILSTAIVTPLLSGEARAFDLLTGEASSAYSEKFCPAIAEQAKTDNIDITCQNSGGSLDNLARVEADPAKFGLAQYDLFALRHNNAANKKTFTAVHDDIGRECLFMVTKNPLIKNFGDIAASAPYLNFILPPENSGHTGTFNYLRTVDPEGIGKAKNITYAASTEDAITQSLTSEDNVTLFVHAADPKSKLFSLVNDNKGHFIPVISREILAEEVKGRKVYNAEETDISNPSWYKSGEQVVTSCTPIILFTGNSENIQDPSLKASHQKAVATLTATPAEKMRPSVGWWTKLWTSSKAISAKGVEGLLEATDKAKKATSPYLKKAKTAAEPYVEKAKETTKDVIDAAKPTYDAAKEKTKDALEAAKPTYDAAKEKTKEATKDAIEAAKPVLDSAKKMSQDAYEKAKEMIKGKDENAPEQEMDPATEKAPQ